jgi:anaerobic selenocysteine-containing dehydrogenase
MTTRRKFFSIVAAGAAAAAAVRTVQAAEVLKETDPAAAALSYKADATKVDKAKAPTYAAGAKCANCALYQGKPTDAQAPCAAFGGKLVAGPGWCAAYAKKP